MFFKFSHTMMFLGAVTLAGVYFTNKNANFYDTRYDGIMTANGQAVADGQMKVYIQDIGAAIDLEVEHVGVNTQNPQITRLLGDERIISCRFFKKGGGVEMRAVPIIGKVTLNLKGEADTKVCGNARIEFADISEGLLYLKPGGVIALKRIDPSDPIYNSRQHTVYKELASKS